jgi:hypothetical protein
MHPNWESHVNEETNSGIFFSLLHMSCIISIDILSVHHGLHPARISGVSSVLSSSEKAEQIGPGGYKFIISSGSFHVSFLGYDGGQVRNR